MRTATRLGQVLRLAAALGLLLLPAACGCRRAGPPLADAELRRRVAEAAAERGRFATLAGDCTLQLSARLADGRKSSLSCSGQIVAESGRGLRLRGEKALGLAKIFDLYVSGDQLRLYNLRGGKFYRGSLARVLAERGAERLLGEAGGFGPAWLLFPTPALDGPGAPELVQSGRSVILDWKAADGRLTRRTILAADSAWALRTELFDARGRRLAVIDYDEPVEAGGLHPVGGFRLRLAGKARLDLEFRLGAVELNQPVSPAAFGLDPPAGVEVIDLDGRGGEFPAEVLGTAGP